MLPLSSVGSLFSAVWRFGKGVLAELTSLLRVVWSWLRENMLKRLILVLAILFLTVRACNERQDYNNMGQTINRSVPRAKSSIRSNTIRSITQLATRRFDPRSSINAVRSKLDIDGRKPFKPDSNPNNANIRMGWYKGIGVSVFSPKGAGIDYSFYRIGHLGIQGGVAYFIKDQELSPSLGLHYNVRKLTKDWTKNTSIFAAYTPKTYIAGIRFEL